MAYTKSLITRIVAISLLGFLTACGDHEADNKLLGGVLTTEDGSVIGFGSGGGNASAANAAQTAAASVQIIGGAGGGFLSPRPAAAPALRPVPSGLFYDTSGFYAAIGSDPELGSYTFRMQFQDSSRNSLAILGTDSNNPNEPANTGLISRLRYMRFLIAGTDPQKNTFNLDVSGDASAADYADLDINNDMAVSGTFTQSGPDGSFVFPLTNLVVDGEGPDEGTLKSGQIDGSGTLMDGTAVSLSLSFSNGAASGTLTVQGQTVTVRINADGTGTYTDSQGSHTIP